MATTHLAGYYRERREHPQYPEWEAGEAHLYIGENGTLWIEHWLDRDGKAKKWIMPDRKTAELWLEANGFSDDTQLSTLSGH